MGFLIAVIHLINLLAIFAFNPLLFFLSFKIMEWFKINIPVQDSGKILESLKSILNYTKEADPHKVGCFTKVAYNETINVFLTEEIIRSLPGNLRLEYNLQKCAPPTQKSDKEGSSLTYQFGHSDLL